MLRSFTIKRDTMGYPIWTAMKPVLATSDYAHVCVRSSAVSRGRLFLFPLSIGYS